MATAATSYRYCKLRIRYFNVEVPAVMVGRIIYFPLRALCKIIGITPQTQIEKIQSDPRFVSAWQDLPVPTIKGLRQSTCLRKGEVGKWLIEIDAKRCSITAQGPLERFQQELFDAADRWLFGDMSDVVSGGEKAALPIQGTLHLGDCPRCGLSLCLEIDEHGAHLRPEPEEA